MKMLTMGWLFSIVGTITTIIGAIYYSVCNSEGYGLYKYYDNSGVIAATIILIIGIVLLVLGIICLLCYYIKKNKKTSLINTLKCLKCGGVFSNKIDFCPNCGNNLKNQYVK